MKILSFSILIIFFIPQTEGQQFEPYFGAVIVNNIDSSVAWYSGVLNLQEYKRQEDTARGYKIVNLGNGKLLLELLELRSSIKTATILKEEPAGTWIRGFMKIGFLVSDIDSIFSAYKKRGLDFRGSMIEDPVTGKKSFIVNDPDGNPIQFFEK